MERGLAIFVSGISVDASLEEELDYGYAALLDREMQTCPATCVGDLVRVVSRSSTFDRLFVCCRILCKQAIRRYFPDNRSSAR